MTQNILKIRIKQPFFPLPVDSYSAEERRLPKNCAVQSPWEPLYDSRCMLRGFCNVSDGILRAVRLVLHDRSPVALSLPVRIKPGEKVFIDVGSGTGKENPLSERTRVFVQWKNEGGSDMLYSAPFM